MRILTTLLAVSFFSTAAYAADVSSYALVKDKSSLKFIAIENGAAVEGVFKDFTAEIKFSPDAPEKSSISVDVAVASVSVANDDVNKNIHLPEWLDTGKFPHAVFKSKTVSRMPSSDNYYADGELTLHGKTLPCTINFQMDQLNDKQAIAKGYATLRRTDFNVGSGQWSKDDVIKNEVRVEFRIVADKK